MKRRFRCERHPEVELVPIGFQRGGVARVFSVPGAPGSSPEGKARSEASTLFEGLEKSSPRESLPPLSLSSLTPLASGCGPGNPCPLSMV